MVQHTAGRQDVNTESTGDPKSAVKVREQLDAEVIFTPSPWCLPGNRQGEAGGPETGQRWAHRGRV